MCNTPSSPCSGSNIDVTKIICPEESPCHPKLTSSNYVGYDGPTLPCTDIESCNTLTVMLQKIDEKLCDLQNQINQLTTTTTTSTSSTTTTTTSTSTSTTTTTTTTAPVTTTTTTTVAVQYNTVIGQTASGALGITSAAQLASKLGISASDIPFFEVDATTFDIRAKINVNYNLGSSIWSGVQSNVTKLIDTDGKANNMFNGAFANLPNLVTVDLPGITNIKQQAFENCSSLVNVSIPNATLIGENSFDNCDALVSINFPNVTSINLSSFANCGALTTINLPLVTTLNNFSFTNCDALVSVTMPSVTQIDGGVFYGCALLETINFQNATSVGGSAFGNCPQLKNVSLPNVTSVGNQAFTNCIGLSTLSLPNATTIGNQCFEMFLSGSQFSNISLPACVNLGSSTGDDSIFSGISGRTITLTIKTALQSDGDVAFLQANNTVTLNLV